MGTSKTTPPKGWKLTDAFLFPTKNGTLDVQIYEGPDGKRYIVQNDFSNGAIEMGTKEARAIMRKLRVASRASFAATLRRAA